MTVRRLANIPGFSIDRVAAAAGNDPEILRMENLDTDIPPPQAAIEATRHAVTRDDANSYLPFIGTRELRTVVAHHLQKLSNQQYDPDTEVVITCGATEGMLDVLLATTDPGDEVILSDPTYAGMINRVRLAGAIPRLVPFVTSPLVSTRGNVCWRLDVGALRKAVTDRTRALFIMSPSMPSGAVLNHEEWNAIAEICQTHSVWLIYNAAMERILYDDAEFIPPSSLPNMRERTITIGSVSKEYRMIGWRIGWVVGPADIVSDIARVHIYNVVTPTGIAQSAACAALTSPDEDFKKCVDEWHKRRDEVIRQLEGFPFVPPHGGWSLLLDVGKMGFDSFTASRLLLEKGMIAATPMKNWGEHNGDQFVRFVFSNEPVKRLSTLKNRIHQALLR